jgi:hypothetical protein
VDRAADRPSPWFLVAYLLMLTLGICADRRIWAFVWRHREFVFGMFAGSLVILAAQWLWHRLLSLRDT